MYLTPSRSHLHPDAFYLSLNPAILKGAVVIQQSGRHFRAYLILSIDDDLQIHRVEALCRFSLPDALSAKFLRSFKQTPNPLDHWRASRAPIDGSIHPYSSSVVLIGDAATASNPA
jgi:hypothetical protein